MVSQIKARAELDERPDAAESMRARARGGDAESAWMLEQWDAGRLVLARVVLSASAQDERGAPVTAEHVIDGVWLERDDPPRVESEIADVAPAALHALADALRERGVAVTADALEASFMHIELDDALRGALAGG